MRRGIVRRILNGNSITQCHIKDAIAYDGQNQNIAVNIVLADKRQLWHVSPQLKLRFVWVRSETAVDMNENWNDIHFK